jgi:probable HAF family extracellular repeat protein
LKTHAWLAPTFILVICAPTRVIAVGPFFVTDLGTLPGGASTVSAADINSRGQVVGQNYLGPGPIFRGFLWSPTTPSGISGSMVQLPPPATAGTAVNDYGQVAGLNGFTTGLSLWTPETANSTTGSIVTISLDNDTGTLPTGINSSGQIAGFFGSASEQRAFLWTPKTSNSSSGSFIELGYLPGRTATSEGRDINTFGQVVGSSRSGGLLPTSHGYLWTPNTPNGTTGSMIDLGDLPGGGDQSIANAINAGGQVVGEVSTDAGPHAFLWSPSMPNGATGFMVDLGALPDEFQHSVAQDINIHGHVVGHSGAGPTTSTRAFLWTPDWPNSSTGKMIDLNSVLEPISGRDWTLFTARAINDLGQIVGTGLFHGVQRAFLLTPVPEPSTLAFSTTGVLLLCCTAFRMRIKESGRRCRKPGRFRNQVQQLSECN